MKANEAPEKLYMNWVNYPLEEMQVEYTRTDAFIEKAAKWIKDKAGSYVVETSLCSYFDYKRAVEDFKNYMKGE